MGAADDTNGSTMGVKKVNKSHMSLQSNADNRLQNKTKWNAFSQEILLF